MWVLRYIWDTDEQREVIAGIVERSIAGRKKSRNNCIPRRLSTARPNADDIYKEVMQMTDQWKNA